MTATPPEPADETPERPRPRRSRARIAVLVAAVAVNVAVWPWVFDAWTSHADSAAATASRASFNGFDVSNTTIPKSEIKSGGPDKDGIPAILDPKFVASADADFLHADDEVLGVSIDDDHRAYPLRVLVWHEIVNDTVGETPIAATYCPLCGTCMVFDRRVGDRTLTFGVSGLLYNSDVLMYDHQTESLWSQLQMESVAGELVGAKLDWLAAEQMTWEAWQELHPESMVLSTDTGFGRNYGRMPYAEYMRSDRTIFPVPTNRTELPKKSWVIGVIVDGQAKAYPRETLAQSAEPIADRIGDTTVSVTYDSASRRAVVANGAGYRLPHVTVYWFAWQAFYPDTAIYAPDAPPPSQ